MAAKQFDRLFILRYCGIIFNHIHTHTIDCM